MTRSSTPTFAAPGLKRCTKPGCGGTLEASVDRNGASVSECVKCATIYRPGIGSTASTTTGSVGAACRVKGCPGQLDAAGQCGCCTRRIAFLEKNLPKRLCEICTGDISKARGGRRFCEACGPINTKVNAAKAKGK